MAIIKLTPKAQKPAAEQAPSADKCVNAAPPDCTAHAVVGGLKAALSVGTNLPSSLEVVSTEVSMVCGLEDGLGIPTPMDGNPLDSITHAHTSTPSMKAPNMLNADVPVTRALYPSEYNSWRAMRDRAKSDKAIVSPEFDSFRRFLAWLGPKPGKTVTVDRIAPDDLEYAPGKVRWADKTTQATNKLTTVLITDTNGATYSVAQIAARHKISASLVYKRLKAGWTHAQLITGSKDIASPASVQATPTTWCRDRWYSFAEKFPLTWDTVNRVEEMLSQELMGDAAAFLNPGSVVEKRKSSPVGRFKQLFDLFPSITIKHVRTAYFYLLKSFHPNLYAFAWARDAPRRAALAKAVSDWKKKDDDWYYATQTHEPVETYMGSDAYAHLKAQHLHPMDAWQRYNDPPPEWEVPPDMSFDEFILRLVNDHPEQPLQELLAAQHAFDHLLSDADASTAAPPISTAKTTPPVNDEDEDEDEDEGEYDDSAAPDEVDEE